MRTLAFWDCPTGISGDMCLGALVSAGVPLSYLKETLAQLQLPEVVELTASTVRKNSIAATKVDVILPQATAPQTVHPPGRHLPEIERIITDAALPDRVIEWSLAIFRRLAIAEGSVHGIPPEKVHFHEVGATDAIIDIVGTCIGLDWLNVDELHCAPLPTGSSTIRAAHGRLPVPAPAVLALMAMAKTPVYNAGLQGELVTPTGAAIATELSTHFGDPPAMRLQKIGLGAGNKEFAIPNILRLWIGESPDSPSRHKHSAAASAHSHARDQDHNGGHDYPLSVPAQTHNVPQHQAHRHSRREHEQTDHEYEDHKHPQQALLATAESSLIEPDTSDAANLSSIKRAVLPDTPPPIESSADPSGKNRPSIEHRAGVETVVVLETQVDDLSPQAIGYLYDRLLESGTLDVFTQPVTMKKSRPGHLITAIAYPDQADTCEHILLEETTTLGVRRMSQTRLRLRREIVSIETTVGTVHMKLAFRPGEPTPFKAHPEYEDCVALARKHHLPWRDVYLQALCCWEEVKGRKG